MFSLQYQYWTNFREINIIILRCFACVDKILSAFVYQRAGMIMEKAI